MSPAPHPAVLPALPGFVPVSGVIPMRSRR